MVRVRFAPSPTGFLHIGSARTALFNWMYARAQGGQYILRIEDTDKVRSKQEYLDEILDSLKWLGLTWDEFYKQSDRFDIYRQYSEKLLAEGKAFKDGEAVVLKVPQKTIKIYDLIRGEITIDTKELKDQVLMKSDGSPTYSFACVVDDALMEISCVIRGEDHISNTPKQILIYEALGFKAPKFAHLPLILDPEGGRMSKRAGATAVTEYRTQGFLPQAIVNYLMLLGWSPGNNQEKVAMASALKTFSIKKINKAGAAFSFEKLQWLNSQYIKEMETSQLADLLKPMAAARYPQANFQPVEFEHMVQLYKGRMNTLADFLEWTDYIFSGQVCVDPELRAKHLSQDMRKEFDLLAERLAALGDFNAKTTEEAFRAVVAQLGIEAGTLVHPVRVALTGKAVGPGLFDTMAVLGKETAVHRLKETFK
ncbi:MAG: glutamate--tRNA ligase [Candidatus Omnitrophica bacterium]|nr:glutamate--tRNA ligase [Candidatus Omnitrophota bacterium]MDE2221649.1 glutamate--tRNA ligase [Candidatus Omnitrophota bacterium]